MRSIVQIDGTARRIVWGADASGRLRAREYFDQLNPTRQARLQAHMNRLAETGILTNPEHFKQVRGNLYCFKAHRHRLACFFDGGDVVLIDGFDKKETKSKRSEQSLRTAEKLRDDYMKRKGSD